MNNRTNFYRDEIFRLLGQERYLLAFDVETTGLQPDAQIIQFAGVLYEMGKEKKFTLMERERMNIYIRPRTALPKRITELTGLTNTFLADYPYEEEAFPLIRAFLSQEGIYCGYNVAFDIGKIRALYERQGFLFHQRKYLDVLEMARDCIPKDKIEKYNLSSVSSYLNTTQGLDYHNAQDDISATARCFIRLLNMYIQAWREERGRKKEKLVLSYCYYWVNRYQKSMQRVIAVTTGGNLYYDAIKKQWGINKKESLKIEDVDLDFIQIQCLSKYKCQDMDELVGLLKKKKLSQ